MDSQRNQLVIALQHFVLDKDMNACIKAIETIDGVGNIFKECNCPYVKNCKHYGSERCVELNDYSCYGYE